MPPELLIHGRGGTPDRLGDVICSSARLKLDQFFLQFLSEHQSLIFGVIDDVVAGRPIKGPTQVPQGGPACPLSPRGQSHSIFSSTPPLSPSKVRSPRSPISPMRRSFTASGTTLKRAPLAAIPQFYFPKAPPIKDTESKQAEFQKSIAPFFSEQGGSTVSQKIFVDMLNQVCEIPTMVCFTLFRKLAGSDEGKLTKDAFLKFFNGRKMLMSPLDRQVFDCLRADGQEYLTFADLLPMLDCVLQHHQGLEFLKETAEFQKKYAETVIYRIFYTLNRLDNGKLSYREFRRGDFLEALQMLDKEDDINKVLKYFSYEHFYVIYCKFWELDTDHDFLIDKNDLARYSQCALSYQIVDRIFEEVPRRFTSNEAGKMGYEDFCWFILSEEDKSTDTAIEYWFKCADLDCDGVIRPREMWHFYEEQLKRMEGLSQEPVLFEDMVCQMHDMLAPVVEGAYTTRDLKRVNTQCGLLFNALFNLHKFLGYENRDPFAQRNEAAEFAGLSDWEKFAKIEYYRLASEDDPDGGAEGEGWPDS